MEVLLRKKKKKKKKKIFARRGGECNEVSLAIKKKREF
jgi:hypothetical protein